MLDRLKSLETLAVSAVILDAAGTIVGVNSAWKEFGRRNGFCLPDFGVGANYLAYCGGTGSETGAITRDLKDLLAGRRDLVMQVYPCDSPDEKRWFMLLAFPLSLEGPSGIAILHTEISSLVPLPVIVSKAPRRPGDRGQSGEDDPLAIIAGSVEASVGTALADQLQAMLASTLEKPRLEQPAAGTSDEEHSLARLSKRQLEVLRLLGEGKTNQEIARALFRSPHTIKLHVSAILRELNLKSRTQAALLASKLPKSR